MPESGQSTATPWTRLMRRLVTATLGLVTLAAVVLSAVGAGGPHAAAGASPTTLPASCTNVAAGLGNLGLTATTETDSAGFSYALWSGDVASFDGLPLEVYLTVPLTGGCPMPLVSWNPVFGADASGSLGSSDTGHWDNIWFAEQGYATLAFTQRGFQHSCGPADSTNGTVSGLPAACTANGRHYYLTFDDMRYNARDLQWLIGDLVDAGLVSPNDIAVSGQSMGGGLSWEMSLLNDRTACGAVDGSAQCGTRTSGTIPWTSPAGVPLHVAASVPIWGWDTLASGFLANGTASDGLDGAPVADPAGADQSPVGIPNESWITTLSGDNNNQVFFAPPGTDPSADWANWFTDLQEQVNSQTASPGTALGQAVSAFASQADNQASAGTPNLDFDADVPILTLQGLNDSVMGPIQAQWMFQKAKAYDPNYPIAVVWGDTGHVPASNPVALTDAFDDRATQLLASVFSGDGSASLTSNESVNFLRCGPAAQSWGGVLTAATAPTLAGIETGSLTETSTASQQTNNTSAGAEATAVDPQGLTSCPSTPVETDADVAAWTWPAGGSAVALAGAPVVHVRVHSTGSDAQLDARLWVEGGANQTLISTSAYRFVSSPGTSDTTVTFEMPMTAFLLEPGENLKLEITGDDAPTFQADTIAATTTIDGVTLTLPTTDLVPDSQSISFTTTAPTGVVPGSSTYSPAARGGASGNPVVFSIDSSTSSGTCTLDNDVVSFAADGTCVIDANQSGNETYLQAQQVQQVVTVGSSSMSSGSSAGTPTGSHGYWLVGSDGGIFSFGDAHFYGSTGNLSLQRPVVGIVVSPNHGGYWLDASDGGVFAFGDVGFYGSIPGLGLHPAGSGMAHSLNAPIVGMVPSATGAGYFMVASDGGVFAFGDARFEGSCPSIGGCSGTVVSVIPDSSGAGYWLVTSTGHVSAFGDAPQLGAPGAGGGTVTSAVGTPDGNGYLILSANGIVTTYGDAVFGGDPFGSVGGLNPATAIATDSSGGYWVSSADGSVFSFGGAPFDGSMAGTKLNAPVIASSGF